MLHTHSRCRDPKAAKLKGFDQFTVTHTHTHIFGESGHVHERRVQVQVIGEKLH